MRTCLTLDARRSDAPIKFFAHLVGLLHVHVIGIEANKTERGMSTKYKQFLNLSERHKRRRLAARQDDPNVCQSINNESDDTLSENEPVQISASHSAPSVSDNALYNDEESTADVHKDTFNGDEEADDNEGIAEEEVQEQEVNTDGGDDDEENEGSDADNTDAHSNDNISNFENDNAPQNLNDLKLKALKQLFLLANLKHKQGNMLLKTLHEFPFNLTFLPKDTRTLLETPTDVASRHVQYIDGGEYLHLGLQYTLIKKLKTLPEDILPETIQIDFSTDGAQIHKSGTTQFWPLQYRIYNCIDKKPIIAGVFKGTEKPSNPFQFFEHFVQELEEIREEGGVLINDRRYPIQIRCFIADAPARAFALNHYGHVSSNACSKCKIEGRRSAAMPFFRGTMIFPGTRHPLRTDQEYSELMDEDHHKGPSPLNRVLGLVTQVPFEPLHLLYVGNVKKVFTTHIHGKYGHVKLTKRKLDILDSRMMECRIYCPTEFNRRPNKISMFHHFKGTEFRQLLLYTAPAVLENVFDEDHYKHFLLLHCVMRLLSLENVSDKMYVYCQAALESYVNMCEGLYGEQFLSYNVHGLLHVVGDVRRLGPLDSYSAFCYENNMPEFRKFIRKPHLALQQFYKRMCELNDFVTPIDKGIHIRCSKIHMDGPLVEPARHYRQYRKMQLGNITFSTALRDSCCITNNGKICVIENIAHMEGNTLFIVKKFRTQVHLYNVGVTSDVAGVYHCSNLSLTFEAINLRDVKSKMYRMPKWSGREGQEERTIGSEWICVSLITPLIQPDY